VKCIKFLVISACLFSASSSFAANDDLSLNIAQSLLEEGKPKDAYTFLLAGHEPDSKNPLEWRLMGIVAKATGRPREAREYFNKVLELAPTNSSLHGETKLELASIAYSLGDTKQAKAQLSEVKSTNPPAKVGDNIDEFIKHIDNKGAPKTWQITGSLGYLYDSNANAGPETDSVLLFGLPFTLSDDAKETSDNALQLSLGFNHNKGLTDDISWQNSFSINWTDYRKLDNLDALVISGASGLSWRINDDWAASVPLVVDWVRIGHDESYYSYSYGIAPQLRYSVNDKLSLKLATTYSKKKYQSSSDRDSDNYSVSPSLNYQINPASYISFGLLAGKEASGIDYYTNDILGINARYGHAFQNGLQASISASYTDKDYEGKEAAYTVARRDKNVRVGLDLSYKIKEIDSNLVFSVSHTNNDSNLPLYEYDRNQISLSLRKTF